MTEISEVKQIVLKEDAADVDESYHRVFLLGENRWEEPSRLNKNKGSETNTTGTATKCLTCRGEGRLLCTGTYCLNIYTREAFVFFGISVGQKWFLPSYKDNKDNINSLFMLYMLR